METPSSPFRSRQVYLICALSFVLTAAINLKSLKKE